MTPEELQQLSKTELIEVILSQRVWIETLEATVGCLQAWVAELKAQLHSSERIGPLATTVAKTEQEMERAVRDALRHLDDASYLAQSRLATLVGNHCGQSPNGQALRRLLAGAIEGMKPNGTQSHQARERRYCDILRLTYLEGKRAREVAKVLGLSERQYYREKKVAIRAVAEHVLGPRW